MTQIEALEIADNWKYPGEYSFYDVTADEEDYTEYINPDSRGDKFFSCFVNNILSAYYTVSIMDDTAELGVGMRPDLTGKGYGLDFVNAVMDHITSRYAVAGFMLIVAVFNQRAIKVYKKAGFTEKDFFMQKTNGGEYEFLRMEKKL